MRDKISPDDDVKGDNYSANVSIFQKDEKILWSQASNIDLGQMNDVSDINVSVEYADYGIGRHLLAILEDWIKGLPNNDPDGSLRKAVFKRAGRIDTLPFWAFVVSLFGSAVFDGSNFSTSLSAPIRYLLISLGLAALFTGMAVFISSRAIKYNAIACPRTVISLTQGDKLLEEKIEGKVRKNRNRLSLAFAGIALAFIVNMLAAYLASKLFG